MCIRDREWNNRSMSDVLPTYTWIVRSEGSTLEANYDFEDAYNGGNSVKYEGNLDAGKANTSLLYSTQIDVTDTTKIKPVSYTHLNVYKRQIWQR